MSQFYENPRCPTCPRRMVLRLARKGPYAGSQFWGCTGYPHCRGLRNFVPPKLESLAVAWQEGIVRDEYVPEYISVGAIPGSIRDDLADMPHMAKALSQSLLLSRRGPTRIAASDHVRLVSILLTKLLQRGQAPPPTLEIERKALRMHGLSDSVYDFSQSGVEMGWEFKQQPSIRAEDVFSRVTDRNPFELEPTLRGSSNARSSLFDSEAEFRFLTSRVPWALGAAAAHWFTPQASLDLLLKSCGLNGLGRRQVDFLFCHPRGEPLIIEIDGATHTNARSVDNARDKLLAAAGVNVVRISNDEVLYGGAGRTLDKVWEHCENALETSNRTNGSNRLADFLVDCTIAAKVQFAIARAIGFGWLKPDVRWNITLIGTGPVAGAGILDVLRLMAGYDALYGGKSIPTHCAVRGDHGFVIAWEQNPSGDWQEVPSSEAEGQELCIAVEMRTSPFHRLPSEISPDIIVRPAFLPVAFATELLPDLRRQRIAPSTYDEASNALETFLRNIFRKCEFRPMQGEAVFTSLRQRDCVVLLPTGAGKSIIYQLAGLLMPGVTIIIDPIIALMEDQVEGLRTYGIDKAIRIASGGNSRSEHEIIFPRVERGEYFYVLVSPERLQIPKFRSSLYALKEVTPINLAVIDEAHCVSEWGHDFRPAYLHLATNLREFGKDSSGNPPPILALTGTASRAVLRDMLADLNIDHDRSDSLIRPDSFDRKELMFEVIQTSPEKNPEATLRGLLNALPGRFGVPRTEFFRCTGRRTSAGIVFVPTVKGYTYGLVDARETVAYATGATVTQYSGGPPKGFDKLDWEKVKRENARKFKSNKSPVLVATKAFGMGIDKPNIRYTIHFGMPPSLENFYQEAGRAGRDRQDARCMVIFSEFDRDRSDRLLDANQDLNALRAHHAKATEDPKLWDDITRALFFHLQNFAGTDQEINKLHEVLRKLGDLYEPHVCPLEFGRNRVSTEKALYRLLRVGIISDYVVDFGARKFEVTVPKFDFERCKESLLEYVFMAQPAKSVVLKENLSKFQAENAFDSASKIGEELIDFTYSIIERSRRRMIQEAILLARKAKGDSEIRARLLDYLQEGFGAENIEQLLQQGKVNLADWTRLAQKVQTAMDAGELRGLCIRALESYPDHPGLLLIRAVAEAMCSDSDQSVTAQGLKAAIQSGVVGYRLPTAELEAAFKDLFDLALTRAPGLQLPLAVALVSVDCSEPSIMFARNTLLARAADFDEPMVHAAVVLQRICILTEQLQYLVAPTNRVHKIMGVLTGA